MRRRDNTEDLLWESIDNLIQELAEVVKEGRKIVEPVQILEYLMAELPAVFKEDRDDVLRKLSDDVRLP